jgi:hypothetical protein
MHEGYSRGGFLAVEMVWLCLTSCYLQALIAWRTEIGSGRQTTNHGSFIGVQWSVILLDSPSDAMPTNLALVSHDCEFNARDAPSLE